MKFKAMYLFAVCLVLAVSIFSDTANAALIKETWTYKITSTYGDYLTKNIDDVISMDFIFDNESQEMTRNTGSKTVVLCTDKSSANNCDTRDPSYLFYADINSTDTLLALFDWDSLERDGGSEQNRSGTKEAIRYSKEHVDGIEIIKIRENQHEFYARDSSDPSLQELYNFKFFYQDMNNKRFTSIYNVDFVSRSSVAVTTASVPEPSTFAVLLSVLLFGTVKRLKLS
jgi:hypothetical protein